MIFLIPMPSKVSMSIYAHFYENLLELTTNFQMTPRSCELDEWKPRYARLKLALQNHVFSKMQTFEVFRRTTSNSHISTKSHPNHIK